MSARLFEAAMGKRVACRPVNNGWNGSVKKGECRCDPHCDS